MQMSFKSCCAGFALLAATTAFAAENIDGKWTAQVGQSTLTLEVKADGEKLTGTLTNSQAGPAPIEEGKIKGDEISFHVMRSINNANTKVAWTGKLAGDELKVKRNSGGAAQPDEFVLKRSK
jgi:uncharacterized protein (DUF2147 family)